MLQTLNDIFAVFHLDLKYILGTLILVLVIVKVLEERKRWKTLPPGPWGFPIIGHLPMLGNHPYKTFNEMRDRYGDIFMIRMGHWPTVVLNNRQLIKDAFVKQFDTFAGRPPFFSAIYLTNYRSIPFGKFDASWKFHHKIANNVLRTFANTKHNQVEELIQNEALLLSRELLAKGKNSVNPREPIHLAAGSTIYQICYGRQKNCKNDEDFKTLVSISKDFTDFAETGNPVDVMPWLQYFMPWTVRAFLKNVRYGENFRKKKVKEHMETFNKDHLRDAADGIILAVDDIMNGNNSVGVIENQLFSTLESYIGAGFDTVAKTTEWFVLYMALFPEVQDKICNEILDVIGDRKANLSDRKNMTYTSATILEVFRMSSLAPLALPHAVTEEVTFKGYKLPKGTVVIANLYAVHRDRSMWKDPESFKPERFLTNANQLNTEAAEYIIPFSAGRRRCLGEFLAKAEVFIIFTTLLQQCEFKAIPGVKYDLEGEMGLTLNPKQYKIQILPRQKFKE